MLECKTFEKSSCCGACVKDLRKHSGEEIGEVHQDRSMQFGYMPGRGTMDAVFILRQVQEKISERNRNQYWAFVDLEKAFDRVSRELIHWSLRNQEVPEECISMVKAMYEDATTLFKCKDGLSESFEMKVGVHQGSKLSPVLFVMVLDALSEETRRGLPWEMLYVDDLVICADDEKSLQENVWKWQSCMERRGLHVSAAKTEVIVCREERESINIVDRHND